MENIMAWRPTEYLREGELDNTTPGVVSGWLRFAGLDEVVSLDLKGDFHRDIRGAKLRIRPRAHGEAVPADAPEYMAGFATHQTGDAGDITAGLPPHDYGRHPYIEWYGQNGRVVVEPESHEVEVLGTPMPWDAAEPVDRSRQDELFSGFVAGMAASVERSTSTPAVAIVARFHPGRLQFSQGVQEAFPFEEVLDGLRRHLNADWGDVDREGREHNDAALNDGGVLLSSYAGRAGRRFIIITTPGRSATMVLLQDEAERFMSDA